MRYLLVALMIVLLPLRGWAGNAMAVEMAAQQVLTTQTAALANLAATAESAMPADCKMTMQTQTGKSLDNGSADSAGSSCSDCSTCQLCLAIGSVSLTSVTAHAFESPAAPIAVRISFSNADRAASLKPPIS